MQMQEINTKTKRASLAELDAEESGVGGGAGRAAGRPAGGGPSAQVGLVARLQKLL